MARYPDGEIIPLYPEDRGEEVVRGHVSVAEFQTALDRQYGKGEFLVTETKHQLAFWGVGQNDMGDACQCLYLRNEPGRGRFKVTVGKVTEDLRIPAKVERHEAPNL